LQTELLRQCGDHKVICVDATHGTNSYDFQLISILVIDEFGEGFPVGWCLSNKEDHVLLKNFFNHLKQNTGNICPEWFMSDMAEQYYSSWIQVFSGKPKKLICTWHIDRAWRKNLYKINDQTLQKETYHMLRVLLEEMDIAKFHRLLDETIKEWQKKEHMSDFLEYFQLHYAQRPQQWAGCYRKRAPINTNMYAESFHRVLKYVYLKGKVNKRMDVCIAVLLRYARDKAFDRIMKYEKGKSTKRTSAIMNRHKASLGLSTSLVHQNVSSYEWSVQSTTEPDTTYTVEKLDNCQKDCWIRCYKCQVCIHSYSCTCPDSLLHGVICKHIHLVIRSTGSMHTTEECTPHSGATETLISSVQNKARFGSCVGIKDRLQMKLCNIATGIGNINDEDTLLNIDKHLKSCISLINICGHDKNEPQNKRILTQRNFYATKRKRKPVKIRIAKPTFSEKKDVANRLLRISNEFDFATIGKSY